MYSFEGSVFNYFAKEREFIKDVRLEGGWLFLFEFENGAALPPEPLPNSCLTAHDRDASDDAAKASRWPNGATAGPSYGSQSRSSAGAPAILLAMG